MSRILHGVGGRGFDYIFFMMMENHAYEQIVGDVTNCPYINNTLIPACASYTNYFALTHPSLPNYLAIMGGSTFGVVDDNNPPGNHVQAGLSLVDLFPLRVIWKSYAEGYPNAGTMTDGDSGLYVEHHQPLMYFTTNRTNPARTSQFSDFTSFTASADFSTTSLANTPHFGWIVPNNTHNMHDGAAPGDRTAGDTWLSTAVPIVTGSKAWTTRRCLLIVTWDEDDTFNANHCVCLFMGSTGTIKTGTYGALHDHYDLLATIERNFGDNSLGLNDVGQPLMDEAFI